jgi:hypothetical protein
LWNSEVFCGNWPPLVTLAAAGGDGAGDFVTPLSFAVLEEFDLAQALFGFGFGFVGAAKVSIALLGNDLVAFFHFFDHFGPPILF